MARILLAVALVLGVNVAAPGPARAMGAGCAGRWSVFPNPAASKGSRLYDVAAVSPTDVWAVGYGWKGAVYAPMAEHWDGSRWTVTDLPDPSDSHTILFGVSGTASDDVWAVGYSDLAFSRSLIEHWDGSTWSIVPSPSPDANHDALLGVAALSPTDVWAVGSSGQEAVTLIEHWNGSSWSVVPSPNISTSYGSANTLSGLAAVSSTQVWAVGMFQNQNRSLASRSRSGACRLVA